LYNTTLGNMIRSNDRKDPYMRDDFWIKDTGKICFWRHPDPFRIPVSEKGKDMLEDFIARKLKNVKNTAILEDKPQ
jgi:hypothetical protein